MNGTHLVGDFHGVEWSKLDDEQYLIGLLYEACKRGNLTVLNHLSYKFNPQGVTVILLLSESHATIHTEPENNRCHIDLYHCGDRGNVYVAMNYLKEQLKPSQTDVTIIKR